MTTVMAFGTFDLLHPGHKYFLRQAQKQGDYLIAIIARDSTVKKLKGKLPQQSEKQRQKAVLGLNLADKAVLGDKGLNKYRVIEKYRPDIISLGYDQIYFIDGLKKKVGELKLNTKIIRLKPYQAHKYKTSIIKKIKKYDSTYIHSNIWRSRSLDRKKRQNFVSKRNESYGKGKVEPSRWLA